MFSLEDKHCPMTPLNLDETLTKLLASDLGVA